MAHPGGKITSNKDEATAAFLAKKVASGEELTDAQRAALDELGGAAPAPAPQSEQPLAVPPHKAAVATAAHSDGAGAPAVAKASLSAAERRLARLARATGGGEADPVPLQPSPAKKRRTL